MGEYLGCSPGERCWCFGLLELVGWSIPGIPADAQISDSLHDDNRLLIQELFVAHIKGSCPRLWAG